MTSATSHPIPFWKSLVLALCAMQIGLVLTLVTGYQLHWSGVNTWAVMTIASILTGLIAAAISYVSRGRAGGGTLLSYVQGVLPHWAVCLVASALLLGYLIGPATMSMLAATYVSSILLHFGIASAASPYGQSLLVILVATLAGYCAYKGLELSAKVSLALGLVAFPVAVAITLIAAVKHGASIDYAAALSRISWADLTRGSFVAFSFFVGFDAVCALGSETANPARNVPRLLAWTVLLVGLTDIFGALVQTPVLLAHTADLEAGWTPSYVLIHASGLDWMYVAFDTMLCMAQLAGIIAWLNLSALIVASAAREGFMLRALGEAHPITGSPYKAVLLLALLSAVVPGAFQIIAPRTLLISSTYLSNVLVIYWAVAYALVCVAAMMLHHRNRARIGGIYLASAAGLAALAVMLVMQDRYPFDETYALTNHVGIGLLLIVTSFVFVTTRDRREALKSLA
jgi:amino acid transporter